MLNNLHQLDLNLLRIFAVLMEERSVSKAAERLNLSQSATSNALKRLRQTLDDELLARRGNIMRPTPLALEFWPYVKDAMAAVETGLDQMGKFDPATMDSTLTIGIDQYSLVILGPLLLSTLRDHAPNMKLSLLVAPPHQCDDRLIKGEFDFLIGQGWSLDPHIAYDILLTEHFVGITRVGHPLTSIDGAVPIDDYLSYRHVLFSEKGRVRRNVDGGLSQIGRTRVVNLTVPSLNLAAENIEKTDDIINLGQNMAAALKRRYALETFEIPLAVESFDIALQWPSQNGNSQMNTWFRQLVANLSICSYSSNSD